MIPVRKPYFKNNGLFNPGGFFDTTSYVGDIRSVVMGLLFIYVGRYFDLWGQTLFHCFGDTLAISNGRMWFHARVGFAMGLFNFALTLANILIEYQHNQRIFSRNQGSKYIRLEEDIALRLRELTKQDGDIKSKSVVLCTAEQRLREVVQRFPFLHDLLWGWPFLLGLSLLFWGHTLDGSPAPSLVGLFQLPDLSFFTVGRAPISALNGISIGALAYVANHAIAKTPRLSLAQKLILNGTIGTLSLVAWYALTMAMSAPI